MEPSLFSNKTDQNPESEEQKMAKTLPEDVIHQILSRLPLKSIVRFTCVSKSWAALIYSSSFAKSHLKQSTTTKPVMVVLFLGKVYSGKFSQHPDENSCTDIVVEEIEYPFSPYPSGLNNTHIVGSCNGLLFLVNRSSPDGVALFNPLTGTYCKIPNIMRVESQLSSERFNSIPQLLSGNTSFTNWFCSCVYDEVNDDYKVVGIKVKKHLRDGVCETSSWIYSTKSGTWRRTADQMPSYNIATHKSGAYVCNALHWVLYDHPWQEKDPKYVAGFDVGTEKFRLLPLPPDCPPSEYSKLNLGVLDGCLCLSCYSSNGGNRFFIVWMMRDYGTENWDRLMKLGHHYDFSNIAGMEALALSENSKLLLVYLFKEEEVMYMLYDEEDSGETVTKVMQTLAFYDVETGSIKSEFILPKFFNFGVPHLHIPSLVNPNPRACS